MKQDDKRAVTVKCGEDFKLRFGAVIHADPDFSPTAARREFTAP